MRSDNISPFLIFLALCIQRMIRTVMFLHHRKELN